MVNNRFVVSAWHNGSSGYGFRILKHDRDCYFSRSVETIGLQLPGNEKLIRVTISGKSFWNVCHELRHKEIKKWLIDNDYGKGGANWSYRCPPKFELEKISDIEFKVIGRHTQ